MGNNFSFRVGDKITNKDEVIKVLQEWKENKALSENICLLVNEYIHQPYSLEFYQKLQSILQLFDFCDRQGQTIISNLLADRGENRQEVKQNQTEEATPIKPILQAEKPVELIYKDYNKSVIEPKIAEFIEEDEEDPYRD